MRTIDLGLFAVATLVWLLPFGAPAHAANVGVVTESLRALDDGVLSLQSTTTTLPDGKLGALVKVQALDAKLADQGAAIKVYEGAYVVSTLAVRPGSAAVLMYRGGAAPFVKAALIDRATSKSIVVDLARTAGAGFMPSAASACADADGFTLLWQEQSPSSGAVLATFARVKADGTLIEKPRAVDVTWALGAIVDDGRGYTVALRYDGQAPDQTRIAFVTLTYGGVPEQHPWWGSRPAMIDAIQMTMVKGVPTAIYRAGDATKSILAIGADKVKGQWGKEADPSTVLSTKGANAFSARVKGGAMELVQR